MFDSLSWQPEICHRICQVWAWKAYYVCKQCSKRMSLFTQFCIVYFCLEKHCFCELRLEKLLCWSLLKFIAWQWHENIEILERLSACRLESFAVLPSPVSPFCWQLQKLLIVPFGVLQLTIVIICVMYNCVKDLFLSKSLPSSKRSRQLSYSLHHEQRNIRAWILKT